MKVFMTIDGETIVDQEADALVLGALGVDKGEGAENVVTTVRGRPSGGMFLLAKITGQFKEAIETRHAEEAAQAAEAAEAKDGE